MNFPDEMKEFYIRCTERNQFCQSKSLGHCWCFAIYCKTQSKTHTHETIHSIIPPKEKKYIYTIYSRSLIYKNITPHNTLEVYISYF